MATHHSILDEIERFCAATGLKPSTVCRRATGNPRLHERLPNKLDKLEADVRAIREFMRGYPVSTPDLPPED